MSAHPCTTTWCTRPADIKVGDKALCAGCWKWHAGWERPTHTSLLDGLRETREADQRKRFAELLGGAS